MQKGCFFRRRRTRFFEMFRALVGRAIAVAPLFILPFFAAGADGGISGPDSGAGGAPQKKILFIASYSSTYEWTREMIDGFNAHFRNSQHSVDIDCVELGFLRSSGDMPEDIMLERSIEKIKGDRPDLVVISDLPAIRLFKSQYGTLLRDTPVIFCGLPEFEGFSLKNYPNCTAVLQRVPLLENIELIMGLFPKTSVIALITDSSDEGVAVENYARDALMNFNRTDLVFINGRDHTTSEMFEIVSSLPKRSVVVYANWRSEKNELPLSFASIIGGVAKRAPGPVFSLIDMENPNVLGGVMAKGSADGKTAAEIAERILSGEKIGSMIPVIGGTVSKISWPLASKFKIPGSQIPGDFEVLGAPPGMWKAHKSVIIAFAVVLAFLLLLLVSIVRRYRYAERYSFIFSKLPLRVTAFDREGRVRFCHMDSGDADKIVKKAGGFSLGDLPDSVYGVFSEKIAEVRRGGGEASAIYDWGNSKRRATFVKLPENRFGRDMVMVVSSDVTELEKTHRELRRAVEHLETTINSIGDGVIATDADGRITMFNPVSEELTGFSCGEALGRKLSEVFNIVSCTDGSPLPSPVAKALETGRTVAPANHTDLIAKDGTRRHIADSAAPISDPSGRLQGAILVFRDVTREYDRRDEIISKNAILENAAEVSNMETFICNADFSVKRTTFSDRFDSSFWPLENGTAIPAEKWLIPEDLPDFKAEWRRLKSGEVSRIDLLYRSDYFGARKYFSMRVVRKEPGNGVGSVEYIGIIQDITKSKQDEFSLKDTTRLLSSILDNIPCSIFVKNHTRGGRYILANRFFREYVGMPGRAFEGLTDFDIFPPEAARSFIEDDERIVRGARILDRIEDVPNPDGSMRKSHTFKTSVLTESGDTQIIGISLDVTELVRAQERMRAYAEQERIINECLRIVLSGQGHDATANSILKAIGEGMGADRCYIFEFDDVAQVANNTHEWCAEGVASQISGLRGVAFSDMPALRAALLERRLVVTDSLSPDGTPGFAAAKKAPAPQGVKTLLAAGIWRRGRLGGFIGVDFVKSARAFTQADEGMIESAARIMELYDERRMDFETLEQSEAEKGMILESMKIPILLFDAAGNLVNINTAAEKMAGRNAARILAEPCSESFCRGRLKNCCHVKKCAATGMEQSVEFEHGGRTYLANAYPVFSKDGRIANIIESFLDMTDFYEGRRELEKAMEAAKAADRAKSMFLATISHELRTPLNAVIGYSELSQDGGISPAERIENLKNINLAASALLSLINDVLDLSRLEAGQMTIEKAAVDFSAIADEISGIFKFRARKQNISMSIDVPPSIPPLMLDPLRMKQVMINIVGNAVKFTDNGRVRVRASFEPSGEGEGVLSFSVEDTGMGISPDFIPRVFDPFERQPASGVRGSRLQEGTGLGLAISKRLVEQMGGGISVESAPGKGSVFTVRIPGVQVAHGWRAPVENGSGGDFERISGKIMIVDDVPMNLKVLSSLLKSMGAEVVACGSAAEAIDAAPREMPSIVMTDLWMPEIGGEELAERLKSDPATASIPIVAVTADTQTANARGLFSAVLLKPISRKKIAEAVAEARSASARG